MLRRSFMLAVAGAMMRAQEQPTFTSEVRVVNVFANVYDKNGALVKHLSKDEFRLFEDGRAQEIRYFAEQSDLPLTLGLLIDTSYSERRMLETERAATVKFLEQVLRPGKDKAFLVRFDKSVVVMQGLTESRERLTSALSDIKAGPSSGGTALYDALSEGASLLRGESGRKAIVVLTDGEDSNSRTALSDAITAVQRADTLAFAVRIADDEIGSMLHGWNGVVARPDGRKTLKSVAKATGGGYFEFGQKKSLVDIYTEVEEDLRNQYSLGYAPDAPNHSGEFRKIQLKTKSKGLVVRARDGYYP